MSFRKNLLLIVDFSTNVSYKIILTLLHEFCLLLFCLFIICLLLPLNVLINPYLLLSAKRLHFYWIYSKNITVWLLNEMGIIRLTLFRFVAEGIKFWKLSIVVPVNIRKTVLRKAENIISITEEQDEMEMNW